MIPAARRVCWISLQQAWSSQTVAIYTTFFVCGDDLASGFPGWKRPLPAPVTRKAWNPFTKQMMEITTTEPEWDDLDPPEVEMDSPQVVAIQGDYEAYLGARLPAFVQTKPHWAAKSLTSVELEPLVASALGDESAKIECALYAHPSFGAVLEKIPDEFSQKLLAMDDPALASLAIEWATRMSVPDYTHTVAGDRIQPDWEPEMAASIIESIVGVLRKRSESDSPYLLTEW